MAEREKLLGTGSSRRKEKPHDPLALRCWHDRIRCWGSETALWGSWREMRCLCNHLSSTITQSWMAPAAPEIQCVSHSRKENHAQQTVNDIGQHRSTSLSLSTPATHLNWCLTGSPNCPLRNLQNTWKYYRSLKQAMKELSIQGITHPLSKCKMDPGCGWVTTTHHFWPFPSSVPKSLQRWLPRCWRWE